MYMVPMYIQNVCMYIHISNASSVVVGQHFALSYKIIINLQMNAFSYSLIKLVISKDKLSNRKTNSAEA